MNAFMELVTVTVTAVFPCLIFFAVIALATLIAEHQQQGKRKRG